MSISSSCTVVIASFFEEELVERIRTSDRALEVLYEPNLLPVPRYPCDHSGTPRTLTRAQLSHWDEMVASADVLFDFDWLEPATLPSRCPNLRWIQATSAGIGGFMARTGLDRSPIVVTTAGGIHAVPLAEFALTGILHFVKDIPQLERWKHGHHWERHTTQQLSGMRALVVGLGGIGRRIASSLCALDVEVWGLGRQGKTYNHPAVSRVVSHDALDQALGEVDVVVLACPLTPETEGLIGVDQIACLKPEAIVVNIARGPVIDEDALGEALTHGRIRGACLDVFAQEPLPAESLLWELDNVIISPHSASTVMTENAALVDLFLDNLGRFREGRPLRNPYDPVAGY